MNTTKPTLTLTDPSTEASGLAKLFEKITGKRVSPAEVQALQRELDQRLGHKRGLNVAPKR